MRLLFHFNKNRPEWIKEFYNQLQKLIEKKKHFVVVGIGSLAVLILIILSNHKNNQVSDLVSLQNKRNGIILHELDEINSVLHTLESNPLNSKQQQNALQSLEQNILSSQKSLIDVAKTSDIQKISGQISSVKDDIDIEMRNIKKAFAEGVGNKDFLDASALPFHIISVDVIAGQPYVSVEYQNHLAPLAVGDALAGWRVVVADYDSGCVELMNEKNQYVKVCLQGE